jgi:uncharacterized membrane protein YfcA
MQTTTSVLESLAFISAASLGETTSDMVDRVNVARRKAVTIRNIALVTYAFICVASLGVLAFSSYTSQYVHIYCETICVAALGACAVNQRVQSRIRQRAHKKQDEKSAAYVVPINSRVSGAAQSAPGREHK